jgi:hypothetical protein
MREQCALIKKHEIGMETHNRTLLPGREIGTPSSGTADYRYPAHKQIYCPHFLRHKISKYRTKVTEM